MVEALLFDLGDTIINFGIGRAQAEILFRHGAQQTYDYLHARGKPLPAYERYMRAHYRKMRNEYVWSKLICRDFCYTDVLTSVTRRLRIPMTEAEIHEIAWMWYEPIMKVSNLDDGVHDMLAGLRRDGAKMAIVSNTFVPAHCMDRHLEKVGLLEFFPVRVYSSNTRYRKPHRRIFEIALEQIGVAADHAIFIGDLFRADIAGARRAGMKTIWKPAAHAAPLRFARVRRKPDGVIRRITQLPEILPKLGWRGHVPPAVRPVTVAL